MSLSDILKTSEVLCSLSDGEPSDDLVQKTIEEERDTPFIVLTHKYRCKEAYQEELKKLHRSVINLEDDPTYIHDDILFDLNVMHPEYADVHNYLLGRGGELKPCMYAASIPLLRIYRGPLTEEHMCYAVSNGDLEVIEYLHKKECPRNVNVCIDAVNNGHLEVLIYLHKNGYRLCDNLLAAAVQIGDLPIFKYIVEHGISLYRDIWYDVITYGNLEILRYLRETNPHALNETHCVHAAEFGHLEILKYLHENGCPWDRWACLYAAMRGELDVLKYLHEQGCPWDLDTYLYAKDGRHLEVVKYLEEHGCPTE